MLLRLSERRDDLTPNLPFPRGAAYEIWEGSGVMPDDATKIGLGRVFPD